MNMNETICHVIIDLFQLKIVVETDYFSLVLVNYVSMVVVFLYVQRFTCSFVNIL